MKVLNGWRRFFYTKLRVYDVLANHKSTNKEH